MNRRSVSNSLPSPGLLPTGTIPKAVLTLGAVCSLLLSSASLVASVQAEKHSQESPLAAKVAASIKTISREKSSAVVRIRCHDGQGEIIGTGFFLDPTGTICTLDEIVHGARDITIERDGIILPAKVVASDSRSGIAFLKTTGVPSPVSADSFLSPLPVTNTPTLTPIISIGYPREQQATPVLGMITGMKSHEGENYFCITHLTASIPLREGEGGSPVLDLSGGLLGMVITGNTQLGLCTILPATAIAQLHHNLLRYGSLNQGWVGALVEMAAVPQENSRTRIVSVEQGSPADTAGIRPGDTLLALGKHAIRNPEDVLDASFYLTAGESIHVTLLRDGVKQTLTLQCAQRPAVENTADTGEHSEPTAQLGGPLP